MCQLPNLNGYSTNQSINLVHDRAVTLSAQFHSIIILSLQLLEIIKKIIDLIYNTSSGVFHAFFITLNVNFQILLVSQYQYATRTTDCSTQKVILLKLVSSIGMYSPRSCCTMSLSLSRLLSGFITKSLPVFCLTNKMYCIH